MDGFVSLEVSPLLADDAEQTAAWAAKLHAAGGRPNLFIKIPGTPAGLAAIEETIFAGVPVNVTLLFSVEQYRGCLEAYTRGIERRVEAGLSPYVASVASVFISRWDGATASKLPDELKNRLGLAIGRAAYAEYRSFFAIGPLAASGERRRAAAAAAVRVHRARRIRPSPTRSTSSGLAAPNTVNTMPEDTLLAFGDHGEMGGLLDPDMEAPSTSWPASPTPASTSTRWGRSSRRRGPRPSWTRGRRW